MRITRGSCYNHHKILKRFVRQMFKAFKSINIPCTPPSNNDEKNETTTTWKKSTWTEHQNRRRSILYKLCYHYISYNMTLECIHWKTYMESLKYGKDSILNLESTGVSLNEWLKLQNIQLYRCILCVCRKY